MDAPDKGPVSAGVSAAIRAFLNECQKEVQPFATAEALGAIRRIFPAVDVTDAALLDALKSEASTAGFEMEYDAEQARILLKRQRLEEWDNEGGASAGRSDRTHEAAAHDHGFGSRSRKP